MLITLTVEICIQQLGRAEEMAFTARRSYASAVLGVIILSVCHTHAFWLIQRTYRRYFYTTWKGNHSSQTWFFVYSCAAADKISTDLRARAVSLLLQSYLLIFIFTCSVYHFTMYVNSKCTVCLRWCVCCKTGLLRSDCADRYFTHTVASLCLLLWSPRPVCLH